MHRIYALSINTFREAVRDRVLLGVLAFAGLVLLFTLALAELSLDQHARVVSDLGLASISFFAVLVSVFLGSSLLYKEIERKTLYVILPRPLHRYEFLLGKYFGITLTVTVFVTIIGAIQLWVMASQRAHLTAAVLLTPVVALFALGGAMRVARDRTAVLIPWSAATIVAAGLLARASGVPIGPVAAALLLTVGEVFVVTAVALLFSSFSTPFLTGAFTLGTWVVGRSADTMLAMQSRDLPTELKALVAGIARVVPNLSLYVPPHHTLEASTETSGPLVYVATAMGYGGLYSAVLLFLAALIFRRRDFL
jgi:ABC-type transport system involved in multi-copper enzyme maturation permease subunit